MPSAAEEASLLTPLAFAYVVEQALQAASNPRLGILLPMGMRCPKWRDCRMNWNQALVVGS